MTTREQLLLNAQFSMLSTKLDEILLLLKVRQNPEDGGNNSTQVDNRSPDKMCK